MQHSEPAPQVVPVSLHATSGGAHAPWTHRFVQQSPLSLQPLPSPAHVIVQTLLEHLPMQHSGSEPHAVVGPLHVAVGKEHRAGFCALSQKPSQQSPHSSAGGRQPGPLGSASHFPPVQKFEQHSALDLQSVPRTRQRPPHTPPKHPSEQQSAARAHATPSAAHDGAHEPLPLVPGVQRPEQHADGSLQTAPVEAHVAGPRQSPCPQRPVQHSAPLEHAPPLAVQSAARQVPFTQLAEQQTPAPSQEAPSPWQSRAAHVPAVQTLEQQAAATAQAAPAG